MKNPTFLNLKNSEKLVNNIWESIQSTSFEQVDTIGRDNLIEYYYQYHPRLGSLKQSCLNSKILDIGTGSGGFAYWKQYLYPHRQDVHITGIDLYTPSTTHILDDFHQINLDTDKFPFNPNSFDMIMMSHLIEHVIDWQKLLQQCNEVLKNQSIIYIETPSPHTIDLPKRQLFIDKGFNCTTINFYDDQTHTKIVDLNQVANYLNDKGYETLNKGYVKNLYLENLLLKKGYETKDSELTSYGLWSKLYFSSFILMQKL